MHKIIMADRRTRLLTALVDAATFTTVMALNAYVMFLETLHKKGG